MRIFQKLLPCLLAVSCMTSFKCEAGDLNREKLYSKISHLPHEPIIRVEMMTDVEGALIEIKGAHNIYDPRTGKKLESVFATSSYYMYPLVDGLKWGVEFPGIFQLLLVPDAPSTSIFLQGKQLKGMLACYQLEGSIGFVNELSVEDFVQSLIGADVPQDIAAKEALAALAIMLRTDAVHQIKNPKNKQFWDIKSTACGYKGYAFVRQDESFIDAMKATRDMILVTPTDSEAFSVEPVCSFSKEEIVRRAEECVALANQGKDAKAILHALFPHSRITMASDINLNK